MKKLLACATIAVSAAACGTSVTGTVDGKTVDMGNAIVVRLGTATGPVMLVFSDVADMCAKAKANKEVKNATGVAIVLTEKAGGTENPGTKAGTYTVTSSSTTPDGLNASVFASKNDASCADTLDAAKSQGNSGTVTLDGEVKAGAGVSGKVAVDFPGSGKLEGDFDAEACDAVVQIGGTPACE